MDSIYNYNYYSHHDHHYYYLAIFVKPSLYSSLQWIFCIMVISECLQISVKYKGEPLVWMSMETLGINLVC